MKMQRVQNGQAAARRSRHSAAPGSVSGKARPSGGRLLAWLRRGDEGQAMVETALVLAIIVLPVMTGIFSLGVAFSNQQALAQAVGIGAQFLSESYGNTKDPCADTLTAIANAAPQLTKSKITLNITMGETLSGGVISGGTAVTGSTCSGSQSDLVSGTYVTVSATYPCNILIFYMPVNLIVKNCQLPASVTELSY
jgi:Flp pilus assembly protein TadG